MLHVSSGECNESCYSQAYATVNFTLLTSSVTSERALFPLSSPLIHLHKLDSAFCHVTSRAHSRTHEGTVRLAVHSPSPHVHSLTALCALSIAFFLSLSRPNGKLLLPLSLALLFSATVTPWTGLFLPLSAYLKPCHCVVVIYTTPFQRLSYTLPPFTKLNQIALVPSRLCRYLCGLRSILSS